MEWIGIIKAIYVQLTGVMGKKIINDLPYISIPAGQLPKIREKIETEQNISEKYKTPPQKLHVRYKNAKRKLVIASQMSKESQNLVKRTAVNRDLALVTPPRKKASSKKQYQQKPDTISSKVACL